MRWWGANGSGILLFFVDVVDGGGDDGLSVRPTIILAGETVVYRQREIVATEIVIE